MFQFAMFFKLPEESTGYITMSSQFTVRSPMNPMNFITIMSIVHFFTIRANANIWEHAESSQSACGPSRGSSVPRRHKSCARPWPPAPRRTSTDLHVWTTYWSIDPEESKKCLIVLNKLNVEFRIDHTYHWSIDLISDHSWLNVQFRIDHT